MRFATLIFALSLTTNMAGQIITDRPDQTESPISVPSGSLQIETGIQVTYSGEQERTSELLLPTSLFRIGLSKSLELRVLSQFERSSVGELTNNGVSDLQIGAKLWIAGGQEATTNVGWLTHFSVPTGSTELSRNEVAFSSLIAVDHALTDKVGLAYNLGYSNIGSAAGGLTYTLALAYEVNSKMSIYVEPFGIYDDFQYLQINADAGIAYLINQDLQFDFSFGTGLYDNRMNYLSTGVSWLIK